MKINYKDEADNLRFENVAIAEKAELRTLYKIKDENIEHDWQQGCASLLSKLDLDNKGITTTEIIETVTFDTLLNRNKVERIDLLQVDVEGFDYEILKLFDFLRMKPRLTRYEYKHLKRSDKYSCKKYLEQLGYDTGAVLWCS